MEFDCNTFSSMKIKNNIFITLQALHCLSLHCLSFHCTAFHSIPFQFIHSTRIMNGILGHKICLWFRVFVLYKYSYIRLQFTVFIIHNLQSVTDRLNAYFHVHTRTYVFIYLWCSIYLSVCCIRSYNKNNHHHHH